MSIPTPRRGYADGPFGQVHYRVTGDGPAVLLFHQAPLTSAQFDNVYGPLASHGLKVVGVDLPGFGMSDATDFVPRVEDYAAIAPAVLDSLGIKTAAMVGHHTGALVATEAAVQFPDRAFALVMAGPFPLRDDERPQFLGTTTAREKAFRSVEDGSHLATLFQERVVKAKGLVGLDRLTNLVVQMLMGRGPFWYAHHSAYNYDHAASLKTLTLPGMFLTNTGDSIYRFAQRARTLRPDFHYVELEGGGVDIVDQQPEAWAAAVAEFVLKAARP